MKIEISKPTKEFYQEFLSILNLYPKLKKNPNLKIKDCFKEYNLYLIFSIVFEIIAIIYFILTKSYISIILLVIFFMCIVLSIFIIKNMNNNLNNQLANSSNSIILIDTDGIAFKNKNSNVKIMWPNVKNILLNKETITFLPKDDSVIICIPSKYQEQLIDKIKKYIKDSVIVSYK